MRSVRLDKNFARIIWISEIGLVRINSIVPDLLSSAKERMVIAGTRNRNKNFEILKRP